MSLFAYAYRPPVHTGLAASRAPAVDAPLPPLEGLRGVTAAKAQAYTKEAGWKAWEAFASGDMPAARQHLARAQRWEAYALTLTA